MPAWAGLTGTNFADEVVSCPEYMPAVNGGNCRVVRAAPTNWGVLNVDVRRLIQEARNEHCRVMSQSASMSSVVAV
jgi:hypothetical protein